MARQPNATTDIQDGPALREDVLQQDQQAVRDLTQLQAAYSDDRDLLNQLLGQAQMADAFAKFSVTVTTSKLAYVKESKLYRSLKGQKSRDGHGILTGTWEEFCTILGRSVEQVDEDLRNLRALGEEALESMSRMGIGYRELRQYRKLPEDQKQALIEVAKAGDKEGFVELAEEMISKHAKEKAELQKERDEALDQAEELSESKKDVESKAAELRKQVKLLAAATPDEQSTHWRTEIEREALEVTGQISGTLRDGFEKLHAHAQENGLDVSAWMKGQLNQLILEVRMLAGRVDVTLDGDDAMPAWMNGLQEEVGQLAPAAATAEV